MSLGDNLKRLRRQAGWTQGELSDKTGIRVAHLSRLEKGEGDPKLSTIYKLMAAFKCSADTLLENLDPKDTDAVLRYALESAMALDDDYKRLIVHYIDMYLMAAGLLRETDSNRRPLRLFIGPHRGLIPSPAIKENETPERQTASVNG